MGAVDLPHGSQGPNGSLPHGQPNRSDICFRLPGTLRFRQRAAQVESPHQAHKQRQGLQDLFRSSRGGGTVAKCCAADRFSIRRPSWRPSRLPLSRVPIATPPLILWSSSCPSRHRRCHVWPMAAHQLYGDSMFQAPARHLTHSRSSLLFLWVPLNHRPPAPPHFILHFDGFADRADAPQIGGGRDFVIFLMLGTRPSPTAPILRLTRASGMRPSLRFCSFATQPSLAALRVREAMRVFFP
mmetsp:Transcript_23093/g.52393  ORF Transcript_23093/g.52393 Transcript_23093/m.52393 type:complete len:241 (-) Transcript_23093:495-1217(-)